MLMHEEAVATARRARAGKISSRGGWRQSLKTFNLSNLMERRSTTVASPCGDAPLQYEENPLRNMRRSTVSSPTNDGDGDYKSPV